LGLSLYLRSAIDYVGRGEYRSLVRKAVDLVYSDTAGIVIWKDLTGDPGAADGKRQPPIRPASSADVLSLVGTDQQQDADADELWQRRLRRNIAATMGLDGCYVADRAGNGPSFMQYLFTAVDNDRLKSNFPGLFPVLAADEAMVEFLYVAPESRNAGFAVNCLLQVTDEARRRGAASVISFIRPTNKGALFVNHLAGFRAQSVRRSKRRFFRRTYSFEPWPPGTSQSLVDLASARAKIS
jgi:GNAT superfamily N-acetyltransferase